MEDYARTALMGMLTVTGPDLAEVLGPVTGRGPVIDALIDGLGPVVVSLLQVGIGLGGRAAAGTVSLGEVEQELRTSGRELIRAAMQAVMDAASAAEERRPGGVDGPDGVRRRRVEDGHARSVATVFGRIRVCRLAYRAPLAANVHPQCGPSWLSQCVVRGGGEAQEVERLRFARTPPASLPGGMPPELEQPGLVRVQLQPEPREPLTKLNQELPRVLLVLEPDHEVVGPPDDDHLTVGVVVAPPRHP